MASVRTLNLSIPRVVSEFQAYIDSFQLKTKVYRLLFRGKGLEFDSYREYSPDDDASTIDWRASVRSQKTLVKKYIEERDLKLLIAIDVGESMIFGSTAKLKCEYAAELASALGYLVVNSGDNLGFIFYSDRVKAYVPPKKGIDQFQLMSRFSEKAEYYGGVSNIESLLSFIVKNIFTQVEGLVIVSDFLSLDASALEKLKLVSSTIETLALIVKDPLDLALPEVDAEVVIEDPVTKQQLLVNPQLSRTQYAQQVSEQQNRIQEVFKKSNIDTLQLITDKNFYLPLARFLKERVDHEGR